MRSRTNFVAVALLLTGLTGWSSAAVSIEAQKPVVGTPPLAKIGPTKLTESECTQLGGTVNSLPSAICNSSRVCHTTDQNGNSHDVCISKSK
jgi:uncharacterized membrane protein